MCGRFIDPNLIGTEAEISDLKIVPFPRRYNVKPTQDVLVLAGQPLVGAMARWRLIPSWFKGDDPKEWRATTFNARIEDAMSKTTFRGPWKYGRCLIPAGGYYEWTGEKGHKQPHYIGSAGNAETVWFAGLTSRWQDAPTCAILTRAANADVRAVHDRMPVILDPTEREAWMGGSDDLTIGADARLRHHPVAPFGIRDDGPELIEPFVP